MKLRPPGFKNLVRKHRCEFVLAALLTAIGIAALLMPAFGQA